VVNFTCPHCGLRTERKDLTEADVEYVDLGNGLPDAVFPRLDPGDERHNDMRLTCLSCHTRAAGPPGMLEALGARHPYSVERHREHLEAVDRAEGQRRGLTIPFGRARSV